MNRRKFFALVPAAVLAPVAAGAATGSGDETPPYLSPDEVRALLRKHRSNPTLSVHKHLSEVPGPDGFTRYYPDVGFVCVDGKTVGFFVPTYEPGTFRESDIVAALHAGRITPETARALRA